MQKFVVLPHDTYNRLLHSYSTYNAKTPETSAELHSSAVNTDVSYSTESEAPLAEDTPLSTNYPSKSDFTETLTLPVSDSQSNLVVPPPDEPDTTFNFSKRLGLQ